MFITNQGKIILQIGEFFMTNWGKYYYKLGQLHFIINWGKSYYKFPANFPFLQNKNTLMFSLLYTLNVLLKCTKTNLFNRCNLPFSPFPNIKKIRVKVGPKTNYISYFMSSSTDRIVVFNNFFH